jgi:putative intracellular protease/amidase
MYQLYDFPFGDRLSLRLTQNCVFSFAVEDFPKDLSLAKALTEMYAAGKVVAAVCHGPVGFEGAYKPDGEPLVKGMKVTGFSNAEETQVGLLEKIKAAGHHTPEDALTALGGIYSAGAPWKAYAVADGKLVTGQNPQSSVATAAKCLNVM